MRSFRILALTSVVAVALVAPNVSAKVCQPRKMITCHAAEFSPAAATRTISSPAMKPAVKAVKPNSPAKTQQAMVCGPWVQFRCRANNLASLTFTPAGSQMSSTTVKTHAPAETQQAMVCGPWVQFRCRANNLV